MGVLPLLRTLQLAAPTLAVKDQLVQCDRAYWEGDWGWDLSSAGSGKQWEGAEGEKEESLGGKIICFDIIKTLCCQKGAGWEAAEDAWVSGSPWTLGSRACQPERGAATARR